MSASESELRRLTEQERAALGLDAQGNPPPATRIGAALKECAIACKTCGKEIRLRWGYGAPPAMNCGQCAEAKRQREEQARREAQERAKAAALEAVRADLPGTLARIGVPPHWIDADFESCRDLPAELVNAGREWAESPAGVILLYGPPGAGKTFLAVATLRHALAAGIVAPGSCRYVSERSYLAGLRQGYGDKEGELPRFRAENDPLRATLLLLDDLGATRLTDWGKGEMAGLVEHRHAHDAHGLATVITSNIDPNGLASAIDGRLASRIAEYRLIFEFPRRDLRVGGSLSAAPAGKKNVRIPPDYP